ncbi:putative muropeptide permease AmpG [Hyphomonas neptunium ATCC 15444]|uniref:Putative muropeptide permease AmpG n=2 Tax=Hyphomonas TaxID=85 RepID=Q0C5G8_HYPNA|nr:MULTISPECIES: muropeptide permease AmpG [Hyphomonas]ABI78748.1 putative muropeptide permease AmpG [Hyphomonas neptunium ATCC 15444]KCZ95459.1 putative muropeptide permease AmpG [Hyphomonas hirschiana VP5]
MTDTVGAAEAKKTPRFIRALRALNDRRMAAMLLLSLAAGLPFGAVLGTLNAWLTVEGVTPSTIGTLSLITLGYAFKYLWSPAFQVARHPKPFLGPRRTWLISLQVPIAILLLILPFSNPASQIGLIALVALGVALLSATHDTVLDAWRIEVARSEEDKDLMAALYQFGYRASTFITGFMALLLAEYIGWQMVYGLIALMMVLAISGTFIAPEPELSGKPAEARESFQATVPEKPLRIFTIAVAAGWALAITMIGWHVFASLTQVPPPSGSAFVREQGPVIVILTVMVPATLAAFLLWRHGRVPGIAVPDKAGDSRAVRAVHSLFRAIFDPLMEMIGRLGWGALLVLLLALTYRFADAVWGAFAYPFYLGTDYGAIGHTMADVAVASKFFGVLMTMAGAAIGVIIISLIGRMPVLVIGAVLAAATNLLFADLARGGLAIDAFLEWTRLADPIRMFAGWAAAISPEGQGAEAGARMARLMLAIGGENLAGGFASVAVVAYLTSVVNPRFAAVQYALLGSLTMLIGTLGRPWLGELIELHGYYTVFIVTFWLGGVAVVLSLLEWARMARQKTPAALDAAGV